MNSKVQGFLKQINKINEATLKYKSILSAKEDPAKEILRQEYRRSFRKFAIDFWKYAGTSSVFIPGIALDAIDKVSMSLLKGHFSNLCITMPSREGKSTVVGVLLFAWLWTFAPELRFLTVSYALDYAMRDNVYFQQVIESDPYQELWGYLFHLKVKNNNRTMNSVGGERIATSLEGRNTGAGADIQLWDDLNNLTDMTKKVRYSKTNFITDTALITRFNNPSTGKLICIQHRSSEQDVIAHMMSKGDPQTVLLSLPLLYKPKLHCKIISPRTGEVLYNDPRTEEDELLSPERYANGGLERIKKSMSTWAFETIYQCNPSPAEGRVFSRDWFKVWANPMFPNIQYILQSWDTAISISNDACFSAVSNWGVFENEKKEMSILLMSSWAGKLEYNDLQKFMIRQSQNIFDNVWDYPQSGSTRPNMILVEGKANGLSLIQSLKSVGIDAFPYNPRSYKHTAVSDDAKTIRARLITPLVENGRVYIRAKAPSFTNLTRDAEEFVTAATVFPANEGAARDLVDTFTMSVDYLQQKRWLKSMQEDLKEAYEMINQYTERDRTFGINIIK